MRRGKPRNDDYSAHASFPVYQGQKVQGQQSAFDQGVQHTQSVISSITQ